MFFVVAHFKIPRSQTGCGLRFLRTAYFWRSKRCCCLHAERGVPLATSRGEAREEQQKRCHMVVHFCCIGLCVSLLRNSFLIVFSVSPPNSFSIRTARNVSAYCLPKGLSLSRTQDFLGMESRVRSQYLRSARTRSCTSAELSAAFASWTPFLSRFEFFFRNGERRHTFGLSREPRLSKSLRSKYTTLNSNISKQAETHF